MLAAWLRGPKRFELGEVDLPAPSDGQVLLDVVACGVCGSNLHDWERPHPGATGLPGAVGHEVGARIAALGPGVTGWSIGDEVALDPSALRGCQACPACQDGATWFCERKLPAHGYGFAEQVLTPAGALHRLPGGVSARDAALVEPLACGVHGLRHSWSARAGGTLEGRDVVVIGAGMLGLGAVAAARWLGAGTVTVAARHPHQAVAAAALGADEVLDAGTGVDAGALTAELRRRRAPVVVEAVGGAADTLRQATTVVGWRGEVIVLGGFTAPQALDVGSLMNREIRLHFPVSYAARDGRHDLDIAIDLLASGRVPVDALATHLFPLAEIGAAFDTAADKATGAIRVLVTGS